MIQNQYKIEGNLLYHDYNTLKYDMSVSKGHSGSPILLIDKDGKERVIGMHKGQKSTNDRKPFGIPLYKIKDEINSLLE